MANERKLYELRLQDFVIPIYGMKKRAKRVAKGRENTNDTFYDIKAKMGDEIVRPFNYLFTAVAIGATGFLIAKGLEKFVY